MWPIIQPDREAIQEYKCHQRSVLLTHQKRSVWARTSLPFCLSFDECLPWESPAFLIPLEERGSVSVVLSATCALSEPRRARGDLLRDVLGPRVWQAGLLQRKPCWQKGLAATQREKQQVMYFKDNRGRKFWLFIGQVDSQGFVLLEILYPRKLAAISAWRCQTVLQNLRFHMKEGGKKQNKQKTLYTLQLQRKYSETHCDQGCVLVLSQQSAWSNTFEKSELCWSFQCMWGMKPDMFTQQLAHFRAFLGENLHIVHALWEHIILGHKKWTSRKIYYLSCK